MNLKLTGLASTGLLLLSPISSAMTAVTPVVSVHAENNWDYDVDNPSLGDYDQLLQNAGPNDGVVDWYPTMNALGENPTAQKVVRQLIDLSIATNDKDSNARKVLFNDTTGNNDKAGYKETYDKYNVALGFIAQILDFNNEKSGVGARLKQAAESGTDDPTDSDGDSIIKGRITEDPTNQNVGRNISDVLGTAFFGNADDAYAQIYVNGYDNVAQNEANIIREATSSITIVAQSKTTGKKATAIFKLNNKTQPSVNEGIRLNNYVDNSLYALDKEGSLDIAGLNMTTTPQETLNKINYSKKTSYWFDSSNGGGTIVVPKGTTAKQIANLITKKKLIGTNSLQESAPMKAIQSTTAPGDEGANNEIVGSNGKTWKDVAYNHAYEKTYSASSVTTANWPGPLSENNYVSSANGLGGPDKFGLGQNGNQYREYNNLFNGTVGYNNVVNNIITTSSNQTIDSWFGGGGMSGIPDPKKLHMIDTNALFDPKVDSGKKFSPRSASSIPDFKMSEGTPYDQKGGLVNAANMTRKDGSESKVAGTNDPTRGSNVGKVEHLFQPSSYFKEAYDANHFATNDPTINSAGIDDLTNQLTNTGSFSNGQVKKSFTYEAPVSSWMYKSYNNPYSTVMSSQATVTLDGTALDSRNGVTNSSIQPQEFLDLTDPNNPNVKGPIKLSTDAYVNYVKDDSGDPVYFFAGTFDTGTFEQIVGASPNGTAASNSSSKRINVNLTKSSSHPLDIRFSVQPGNGDNNLFRKFGAVGTTGDSISFDSSSIGGNDMDNTVPPDNSKKDLNNPFIGSTSQIKLDSPYDKFQLWNQNQYFVQTWDKNIRTKDFNGKLTLDAKPIIYNKWISPADYNRNIDSPNFEGKYYIEGTIVLHKNFSGRYELKSLISGNNTSQGDGSKRAYFNSNLYNNPSGDFSYDSSANHKNNSRYFVSQDFSIGPVSTDMIADPGDPGAGVTIDGTYYPYGKNDPAGKSTEDNASKILKLAVLNNDPTQNETNIRDSGADKPTNEFTDSGADGNGHGTDGTGYKLVTISEAASKQGVTEDELAQEVSNVTGKSKDWVKSNQWVEATLPRLNKNAGNARINVVVYDKEAVPAPSKQDTKPSFSTTDISGGNDPFNVNFRPYTTTYDDGAVLKAADVPQNFKNLLARILVAGNPDLVGSPTKLQQILVSSFLDSWQQNDGSFKQTDKGVGVSSPLYMYGGFGISNSDTKNSYAQWPMGYADNSGDYNTAINNYQNDFYRGSGTLKTADNKGTINGIPFTALTVDTSKLDMTKAGSYPVVYTYTNPSDPKDKASITVPVTVSDSSAPVFSFQGSTNTTIHVGDNFDINNYKVVGSWSIFNNYGGDYNKLPNFEGIAKNTDGTPQVTVTGTVDTRKPGIYQVTYKATSTSGAVTEMVRNITVLPSDNSNTPSTSDWEITAYKAVGYINYVPGYGIMVYNAPAGASTGQRLVHGSSWKISHKAVNAKGETFYRVGNNQWINGKYVTFSPINTVTPLRGEVKIVYKKGYGVNLWKSASTTNGYYAGRKLMHGSHWKVSGKQNGFYKVGKDQWIQGEYAGFMAY
ncbi:immunoglobulin-like domain-containing protein [Xylocopilactobacillus apis]|uniref:Pesticidal crystal protein Cry22Aa Ig-like domain-containing protein n=1 Tax=Xylocopilactobacillus apis TaxID=2932183 RepID=A0AAU9DAW2_9LACO|nr:immunoglobulin-like domain-containing protein [Xylocopilactobacillus apis]BDR56835.1 hypothetical protein KIMC2_13970 [Xylocopilactobacillus apis]